MISLEDLKERQARAVTITGTQKLHFFEPVSQSELRVKTFSSNDEFMIKRVNHEEETNDDKEVSGYITVIYDNKWYLAYTISKDSQRKEATVVFLKPHGPSKTFKYSKVDVSTKDGINYKLNSAEQKRISRMLNKKIYFFLISLNIYIFFVVC